MGVGGGVVRRAHPDEPVVSLRLLEQQLDADRIVLLRSLSELGLTCRPPAGSGVVVPAGVAWAVTRAREPGDEFARSLEPQLREWAARQPHEWSVGIEVDS